MEHLEQVYQHALEHKGATYHLERGPAPDTGYMVATVRSAEMICSSLTRENMAKFIKNQAEHLIEENNYLGIWQNPDNGWWYFDVVSWFEDKQEAHRVATMNRQIAFYDLSEKKDITV